MDNGFVWSGLLIGTVIMVPEIETDVPQSSPNGMRTTHLLYKHKHPK